MIVAHLLRKSLLLLICSTTALAAVEPLRSGDAGGGRERLHHALLRLSAGELEPWLGLPDHIIETPYPGFGHDDPALRRHWQYDLRRIIAAQPAIGETLVADLERRLLAGSRDPERVACYLPAPSAKRLLQQLADRAFDRGRYQAYLALRELLLPPPLPRDRVARELRGVTPLPERLGQPRPAAAPVVDQRLWASDDGLLMALDGVGRVRWQRRLPARATAVTGEEGAIIVDGLRLGIVALDGKVRWWPASVPTRVLGIRAGAAWFARQDAVYRLPLDGGRPQRLALAAPVIGPPLVDGDRFLFLDPQRLRLLVDGQERQSFRHGLPVEQGWRLQPLQQRPGLQAPDGRRWLIGPPDRQGSPLERLQELSRGSDPDQLWRLWRELEPAAQQDDALRAAMRRALIGNPAAIREEPQAAMALMAGEEAELLARHLLERDGYPVCSPALQSLLAAAPDRWLPLGDDDDPLRPADSWDHAISARGLRRWIDAPSTPQAVLARAAEAAATGTCPVLSEGRPIPAAAPAPRWEVTTAIEHGDTDVTLSAQAGAGPLWRHRWRMPGVHVGHDLVVDDEHLLLMQPGGLAYLLEAASGRLLRDIELRAGQAWSDLVRIGRGREPAVCALWPAHRRDRLTRFTSAGEETWLLPRPARWQLPIGAVVLVGDDKGVRVYPGGTPLPWPALPTAEPQSHAAGLLIDGRLHTWRHRP